MEPIKIKVPSGAEIVFNHLYRTADPALLTADLLGIALPGQYFIDVSWYPEGNPKGEYTIALYHKLWDNKEGEYETPSLELAVEIVQALASKYCEPVASASNTITYSSVALSQPLVGRRQLAEASA